MYNNFSIGLMDKNEIEEKVGKVRDLIDGPYILSYVTDNYGDGISGVTKYVTYNKTNVDCGMLLHDRKMDNIEKNFGIKKDGRPLTHIGVDISTEKKKQIMNAVDSLTYVCNIKKVPLFFGCVMYNGHKVKTDLKSPMVTKYIFDLLSPFCVGTDLYDDKISLALRYTYGDIYPDVVNLISNTVLAEE